MAVKWTTLELPWEGGLGQSTTDKRRRQPLMDDLANVRVRRKGAYAKAWGWESLGAVSSFASGVGTTPEEDVEDDPLPSLTESITLPASPNTILGFNNQVGIICAEGFKAYDDIANSWYSQSNHSVHAAEVTVDPLQATQRRPGNADICYNATHDIITVVWSERSSTTTAASTHVAFYRGKDMTLLRGPVTVPTIIAQAHVVTYATNYVAVVGIDADAASGNTYVSVYDLTSNTYTFGTAVLLQGSTYPADVFAHETSSVFVVGLKASTSVNVRTVNSSGAGVSNVLHATTLNVSVYMDATHVYYAKKVTTTNLWQLHKTLHDLTTVVGATTVLDASTGAEVPRNFSDQRVRIRPFSSTRMALVLSSWTRGINVTPATAGVTTLTFNPTTLARTNIYWSHNNSLRCGPVYDADATGANLLMITDNTANTSSAGDTQTFPAMFLSTPTVIGNGDYALAHWARILDNPGELDDATFTGNVVVGPGNCLLAAVTRQTAGGTETAPREQISTLALVTMRVGQWATERKVVETESGMYMGAGQVGFYDGLRACENSLVERPILISAVTVSGVSGGSNWGSYTEDGLGNPTAAPGSYVTFTCEWTDAYGRRHRTGFTPPRLGRSGLGVFKNGWDCLLSIPDAAVVGAANGTLRILAFQSIELDTVAVGSAALLAEQRRLSHEFPVVYNPANPHTVNVVVPHTSGVTGEVEYDQTGELTSEPALTPYDVAVLKNRVFYITPTRDRIRYSKSFTSDFAAEFNDVLEIRVSSDRGKLVALAAMDDNLIIFAERGIFTVLIGNGPSADGSGSSFGLARPIPADGGCISPRSVAVGPVGIYFQSQRGIYLLSRQLSVGFVGHAVQDLTEGYRVTAAEFASYDTEVRFHLSKDYIDRKANGQQSQPMVVHNYEKDIWTRHDGIGTQSGWGEEQTYLNLNISNGIFREDNGWDDATPAYDSQSGGNFRHTVETGWIPLAGISGFQRIRRIHIEGEWYDSDVLVTVMYDYDETDSEFHRYLAADLSDPMHIRLSVAKQKCKAIRIKIQGALDLTGDPPNQNLGNCTIEGIQLEVGVKGGTGFKRTNQDWSAV